MSMTGTVVLSHETRDCVTELSSEEASPVDDTFSEEYASTRTLDICLTYSLRDNRTATPQWMTITIPCIIPLLNDLMTAHPAAIGGMFSTNKHNHDFDKPPSPLPNNFNILKHRFPFVSHHHQASARFHSPSPPGVSFTAFLSSACIGSILYYLGGDHDDIVYGHREIYNDVLKRRDLYPSTKTETTVEEVGGGEGGGGCGCGGGCEGGGGICHRIWYRDTANPDSEWRQGAPLVSPRLFPRLVSYQGKLYAFGGNRPCEPFAEVYDPKSEIWTLLEPAPFGRLSYNEYLVVPLNGCNRLWLFSWMSDVDYTYDVLTGNWEKLECAYDIFPVLDRRSGFASVRSPDNQRVVYWVNFNDQVYAYNLSDRALYRGYIDNIPSKLEMDDFEDGMYVCLSHLYSDIFCLIGRRLLDTDPYSTMIHVTLLKISITDTSNFVDPYPVRDGFPLKPLSAAVLACFAYPFEDNMDINNVHIMSDDIEAM